MLQFHSPRRRVKRCGVLLLCCMSVWSGCGGLREGQYIAGKTEDAGTPAPVREHGLANLFDAEFEETGADEDDPETAPETPEEPAAPVLINQFPGEKDGMLRVNAGEGEILSSAVVIAKVDWADLAVMICGESDAADDLKDRLTGYARWRMGGLIFEWLFFRSFDESAVVFSGADDPSHVQSIKCSCGYGWPYPAYGNPPVEFVYTDVNFDGMPDFLLYTGTHGNQCAVIYDCFLQNETGFEEAWSFLNIFNPLISMEKRQLRSSWRGGAAHHGWEKYEYKDGKFVCVETLEEEWYADVQVIRLNGEEIVGSDADSVEESDGLFDEWFGEDEWDSLDSQGAATDFYDFFE